MVLSKDELLTASEEALIDDEQLSYIRNLLSEMRRNPFTPNVSEIKPGEEKKTSRFELCDLSST